jgi:hypothetical protein
VVKEGLGELVVEVDKAEEVRLARPAITYSFSSHSRR